MKNNAKLLIYSALLAAAVTIAIDLAWPHVAHATPTQTPTVVVDPLTHQQRVWEYALEWCESRGVQTAVNPKDRDNTPSYYSWQFKPSTFRYFAFKYGVLATTTSAADLKIAIADYSTEQKVVDQMILHRTEIKWSQQFPDCVKRLGPPPAAPKLSPKA